MRSLLGALWSVLVVVALHALHVRAAHISAHCFPFGTARLNSNLAKPRQSLNDWWCGADRQYGFMGFSYPLENANCNDHSNSLAKMNKDFRRMKEEFGATMVRVYGPECRSKQVWSNLLRAGVENNMAVIPQVWWGFLPNQDLWKQTAAAILAVLADPELGPVAPYVFHSIAFGSEPIGDWVDGGPGPFTADLKKFKASVAPYGIPVTISEDWDRVGIMSTNKGGLGPVGQMIAPVVDLVQAHIMPYYHANLFPTADNVWPYFEWYIPFLERNLPGKPILISQTLWSSIEGGSHDRGFGNPGENLGNFTLYWNIIQSKCEYFKAHKVGWFVHTYDDSQEPGLGMLDASGNPKMAFDPPRC